MEKIVLDEMTYKVAKKKKNCIYASYENMLEGIKAKDKVLITMGSKKKKVKVKNTYEANSLEELKTLLNKKAKHLYPTNLEDKKEKVYAIEFKSSLKLIRKLLFLLLIVIVLLLGITTIKIKVKDYHTKKSLEEINKIKETEISYVFIEINPKVLLELKGDVVINRACLNEDCLTIFDHLEIQNKNLEQAVDILYQKAKEKGMNVTNGVKVSSTNSKIEEKLPKKDYITYHKIDKEEEQKRLTEVLDNQEIVNSDHKKSYQEELLEAYKKDKDYGKIYTCSINNNDLSCYITDDFYHELGEESETIPDMISQFDKVINLMAVFDKFGIKYTTTGIEGAEIIGYDKLVLDKIYVNGDYRSWGNVSIKKDSISINGGVENQSFSSAKAAISLDDYDLGEAGMYGYDYHVLPLNKLNLIDSSYRANDVIALDA